MDLNRWKIFRKLEPTVSAQVKLAYTWGSGTAAFVVMENDDVYCIGSHDGGILDGKRRVRSLRKMEALCGKGVVDFQSGISFAVALTKDGKLYEWIGEWQPELRNEFGENTEITKIAAGVYHVMALTACGKVFCWGSNITGQVGIGSTMEIQQNPRKIIPATDIDIDQKIVSIACGTSSSFAIGQDGLGLGGNKMEIGIGVTAHQYTPKLIFKGKNIATIACSSTSLLAVSKDFNLYYWRPSRANNETRRELKGTCINPILDVGSSVHSDLSVYSTTKSVSMLGEWFGKLYDAPTMVPYSSVDEAFASGSNPTMCRPIRLYQPPVPGALASLEAVLDDDESSDVDFVVDEQIIHAHKSYLKKRSPYFAKMFANDWKENSAGAIKIENYSYTAFRSFLSYLYTEKIESMDCDSMLDLLKAANYYQEHSLFRACEELLKLNVTVENACLVYAVASEQDAEGLKGYVLDFAKLRFRDIAYTEGFASLDKKLTTQLIRELIVNRKLAESNDSDTDEEQEEIENAEEQEFRVVA